MTFGLPIELARLLAIAGGIAGLIVVAYILKMRRRRFEVPFSTLWQRILKERESNSLWRHLRRLLSLLLLLSILALLALAASDPILALSTRDAKNIVFIVDASSSMRATDAEIDHKPASRIDRAKNEAHDLIGGLGGGDAAMIIAMDSQATPLSRFESDPAALRSAIDSIAASDSPADLRRALATAADALRERQNPMIVLIGDGAHTDDALEGYLWQAAPDGAAERGLATVDLSGIQVHYAPVGSSAENAGIISFNARRYVANKLSYEVFIEAENFGTREVKRKLVLYNGDTPVEVRELTLPPGKKVSNIYRNISGGDDNILRARLSRSEGDKSTEPPDPFAVDDEAFALLPDRKRQEVLLVTDDNLYLEGAMLVYDNIRVDKLTPAEYEKELSAGTLPEYDAVVFDDVTPARTPAKTHLLYFNPSGEHAPFELAGALSTPRITDIAEDHPVMRWIEMGDVNFDRTSTYRLNKANGEVALMTSVRSPVAVAGIADGRKIVAMGFSLPGEGREAATDIVLRVAFPLLLVNTLDWFASDDADLITTYPTGKRIRVRVDGAPQTAEGTLRAPSGRKLRVPINDGVMQFYADEAGVYTLEPSDQLPIARELKIATNLANPFESDIEPSTQLHLGGVALARPPTFSSTPSRSLWSYLVVIVLALLSIEWLTYSRRITV